MVCPVSLPLLPIPLLPFVVQNLEKFWLLKCKPGLALWHDSDYKTKLFVSVWNTVQKLILEIKNINLVTWHVCHLIHLQIKGVTLKDQ